MKKEDYDYIENTLRSLSLFIRKCKLSEEWAIFEKEREKFKRLFYIVGSTSEEKVKEIEKERVLFDFKKKPRSITGLTLLYNLMSEKIKKVLFKRRT